jgi:hypothetical protein
LLEKASEILEKKDLCSFRAKAQMSGKLVNTIPPEAEPEK